MHQHVLVIDVEASRLVHRELAVCTLAMGRSNDSEAYPLLGDFGFIVFYPPKDDQWQAPPSEGSLRATSQSTIARIAEVPELQELVACIVQLSERGNEAVETS